MKFSITIHKQTHAHVPMALNNKEKIRGLIMGAAFTIQYWCFTKTVKSNKDHMLLMMEMMAIMAVNMSSYDAIYRE